MIVQVRTSRDLLDTLRIGMSPAWAVSKASLRRQGTTRVHVVNWNGSIRIEGDYSEERSVEDHPDHPPGRTVIAFTNPRIALCRVDFPNPRNPVSYHEDDYEEATRAEPYYRPVYGWPPPSRDDALALYDEMNLQAPEFDEANEDEYGAPEGPIEEVARELRIAGDAHPKGMSEYRQWLSRTWDESGATALVIGINPSTATEASEDGMSRFLVRLLSNLRGEYSCGRYVLVNCCDLRSTKPESLKNAEHPCSPANLPTIKGFLKECDLVVASWGTADYGPTVANLRSEIAALVLESGKKAICFGPGGTPVYCSPTNRNSPGRWSDQPVPWTGK